MRYDMFIKTFSYSLEKLESVLRPLEASKQLDYNARTSPQMKDSNILSDIADKLYRLAELSKRIADEIESGQYSLRNTYDRSKWTSPPTKANTIQLGSVYDELKYLNELNFKTQKVFTKLKDESTGIDTFCWFNKMADNQDDEILYEEPPDWKWGVVPHQKYLENLATK